MDLRSVVYDLALSHRLIPAVAEHLLGLHVEMLSTKVILLRFAYTSAPAFISLAERDLAVVLGSVEVVKLVA